MGRPVSEDFRGRIQKAYQSLMGATVKQNVRLLLTLLFIVVAMSGMACSKKRQPLVPLLLEGEIKPQATQLTEQGTQAFQARQFEDAKRYFEQAMAAAPESGQAHYNYALALNALGNIEVARRHFMEAADLAPGDKVIWDSPALAPYGNPEVSKEKLDQINRRRTQFPSMPRNY